MSPTRIVTTLLATAALALLPVLAPAAIASPCAAPCGEVVIVTDCLTAVVNAEGTSTLGSVVWTFVASETDGGATTTVTQTYTGPGATFSVPFTRQSLWYPWYLGGTLYADGVEVASGSDWCPGIH